jgi:adenosylcobinamide-GDP ribazoletransferase
MSFLVQQLKLVLVALQFFTRVPISSALVAWMDWTPDKLRASSRYFPLIGLGVGVCAALVFSATSLLWNGWIAAALSLAATALLTGAFHEDGFTDYWDAMGGGMSKDKTLAIMKDSRIGAYGALAMVLITMLKINALAGMSVELGVIALIAAHSLARAAACVVLYALPYVRDDDTAKSKPLAQSMCRSELAFALCMGVVPLFIAAFLHADWALQALAAAVAVACVTALMARRMQRRIGGFTGDALGAVEQTAEVAVLLAFAVGMY